MHEFAWYPCSPGDRKFLEEQLGIVEPLGTKDDPDYRGFWKRMNYTIRSANAADEPFLWQMLYYAAHIEEDGAAAESARTNPDLTDYVAGWGKRAGDVGVIAVTLEGSAVGAAWARAMPARCPLYRLVAPDTPEVAIARRS